MRVFIAINLPKETKSYLEDLILELEKNNQQHKIKWVETKNLHLTLNFIEEIQNSDLQLLIDDLKKNITFTEFTLSLNRLGLFPNNQAPRVIKVDLVDSENKLAEIKNNLNQILKKHNIETDERPFSPHITLGRIKWGMGLIDLMANSSKIAFQIKSIDIMKSELTPRGPIYSKIHSITSA